MKNGVFPLSLSLSVSLSLSLSVSLCLCLSMSVCLSVSPSLSPPSLPPCVSRSPCPGDRVSHAPWRRPTQRGGYSSHLDGVLDSRQGSGDRWPAPGKSRGSVWTGVVREDHHRPSHHRRGTESGTTSAWPWVWPLANPSILCGEFRG